LIRVCERTVERLKHHREQDQDFDEVINELLDIREFGESQ